MKTTALSSLLLFCLVGCTGSQASRVAQTPNGHGTRQFPMTFDSIDDQDNPYTAQAADPRSAGDWITTEMTISGKPMTVQQRVLSRDGAERIIEVAIKDGHKTQTFRLRTETTRGGEQVLDVTRVEGGTEHATTLAAYDAAMQKTVPNVDRNDGMLDTEPVAMDLGGRKVTAMRTTYKVVVAGKPATMSVIHSDGFAWGDLGGDIVAEGGKMLYTTRVVDTGNSTKTVAAQR